jgi:hypothetical protein
MAKFFERIGITPKGKPFLKPKATPTAAEATYAKGSTYYGRPSDYMTKDEKKAYNKKFLRDTAEAVLLATPEIAWPLKLTSWLLKTIRAGKAAKAVKATTLIGKIWQRMKRHPWMTWAAGLAVAGKWISAMDRAWQIWQATPDTSGLTGAKKILSVPHPAGTPSQPTGRVRELLETSVPAAEPAPDIERWTKTWETTPTSSTYVQRTPEELRALMKKVNPNFMGTQEREMWRNMMQTFETSQGRTLPEGMPSREQITTFKEKVKTLPKEDVADLIAKYKAGKFS